MPLAPRVARLLLGGWLSAVLLPEAPVLRFLGGAVLGWCLDATALAAVPHSTALLELGQQAQVGPVLELHCCRFGALVIKVGLGKHPHVANQLV